METTDKRGDVPSQQCSNCECSSARCWCLDCNEALCDDCVSAHRRVTLTRCHRLLNQASDDSGFISPTKFCKLHPSETLKLFCLTCVQLTCRDCQLESHKNHRFRFVDDAVDGVLLLLQKQMDAYMQLLREKMEASTKSLQDMETRLKFLSHCEFLQTADLQRVFKTLVQLLKRRIECLLKGIQKVYESEREMITARLATVKRLQESHGPLREVAEKARNTTDPLVLMNYIEQMKPRVKDLVDQDSSPPPNMTNLRVVTESKIVEGLLNFGELQVLWIPFSVSEQLRKGMEKLPTPPFSSSSSPTVTPPTTSSHALACTKTNSNGVFSPVSSGTSSTTTSFSNQSGSSCKTTPQTGTSGAVPSVHQSCYPLSSSSNVRSPLTVSNPSTGKTPVSQVTPVSPFPISHSSSVRLAICPSLSQTMNVCDYPRTTAGHRSVSASPSSFITLVSPVSSLSYPAHKDPIPGTTTTSDVNTFLPSSLISPSSQSTKRPETSESYSTTTKRPETSESYSTTTKCPETSESYSTTTKRPETSESYSTTTKRPETSESYSTTTKRPETSQSYSTTTKCPETSESYSTTTKRPETSQSYSTTTKRPETSQSYSTTTKRPETSESYSTTTKRPETSESYSTTTKCPETSESYSTTTKRPETSESYSTTTKRPETSESYSTTTKRPETSQSYSTTTKRPETSQSYSTTTKRPETSQSYSATTKCPETSESYSTTTKRPETSQSYSTTTKRPETSQSYSTTTKRPETSQSYSTTTKRPETSQSYSTTTKRPETSQSYSTTTKRPETSQSYSTTTKRPETSQSYSTTTKCPETSESYSTTTKRPETSESYSTTTKRPETSESYSTTTKCPETSQSYSTTTKRPETSQSYLTTTKRPETSESYSTTTKRPETSESYSTTTKRPETSQSYSTTTKRPETSQSYSTTTKCPETSQSYSTTIKRPETSESYSTTTRRPETSESYSTTTKRPETSQSYSTTTKRPETSQSYSTTTKRPETSQSYSTTTKRPETSQSYSTTTKRPETSQSYSTTTKRPETSESYSTTIKSPETSQSYSTTTKRPETSQSYSTTTKRPETSQSYSTTTKRPETSQSYSTTTKRPETSESYSTTTKRPETSESYSTTTKRPETSESYSTTTKRPETSESYESVSKFPASIGRFNILTKSQLELQSGKFLFKFRYKKDRASRTSLSTSISSGVKTTSVRPKTLSSSSSTPSSCTITSSSSHPAVRQSLTQTPLATVGRKNCQPFSSTLPSSAGPLLNTPISAQTSLVLNQLPVPSQNQPAVMLLTNRQPSISSSTCVRPSSSPVVQPVDSIVHQLPSSNSTYPVQQSLVLNQLPVCNQIQSSVVLLTNPQPAVPASVSSYISIFPSPVQALPSFSSFPNHLLPQTFSSTGQPLTSTLPLMAGPNPRQSSLNLNQQPVPGQNQPALVQLKNSENVYPLSGSGLNHPTVLPQFPVLQNGSCLHSVSTVQKSCVGSQFSLDSLVPQAVLRSTTENASPATQCCLTSSNQRTLTNKSCAASDSQVLSHQSQTSNSRPSLQQNLESKMVVGSTHGVQDQEVQQESEVDKRLISVSESAVVEFRERRPAEKLCSPETPQIKETAELSQEIDPDGEQLSSKIYQVTQNIVDSGEINLIVGPFSSPSSDIKLTITSLDKTDPPGTPPSSNDVEPVTTKSEKNTAFDGLSSPVSSDDELTMVSPEKTKPTRRLSSPEVDGIEGVTVKSEETEIRNRLFAPISSEEELTVMLPEETEPTRRWASATTDDVEPITNESKENKPFGGQGSPSEETDPSEKQPSPERFDVEQIPTKSDKVIVGGSSFSPGSSGDEPTTASSENNDLALNRSSSETLDSEDEDPRGPKTRQQDFSQPLWQPKVSLVRLPVSVPKHGSPLPNFHFILGESKEENYLQECHGSNYVSDDATNHPSSPESPLSVEVISCSACTSPNASKICSDCGRGYHRDCHIPPVGPDIWSEWTCSLCQDLMDPSDPYSSDRPQSLEPTRLSLQDQRRCETLLLHLKVEGCGQFSELDFWTNLMLVSERLTHHRPPPYQTAVQLVADLWIMFQDASQDDLLFKLQQSFQKKLVEVLGGELHPSLLMAPVPNGPVPSDDDVSETSSMLQKEDNFSSRSKLKDLRKRLRDFLALSTKNPAAKKFKNS